jgi:hypothetical protein
MDDRPRTRPAYLTTSSNGSAYRVVDSLMSASHRASTWAPLSEKRKSVDIAVKSR